LIFARESQIFSSLSTNREGTFNYAPEGTIALRKPATDMKRDFQAVKRLGFKALSPVTSAQLKICMLAYAKGAPAAEAAKKAGIELAAFKLYLEQDNFSGDLRKVVKGLVADVYAPTAFAFLHECVIDSAMSDRVRLDAAKAILDRSGYTASPLPAERDPGDITQLSGEELHALAKSLQAKVDEAHAQLASEAKDVTPSGEDEIDETDVF
jgi:hypothetical protein